MHLSPFLRASPSLFMPPSHQPHPSPSRTVGGSSCSVTLSCGVVGGHQRCASASSGRVCPGGVERGTMVCAVCMDLLVGFLGAGCVVAWGVLMHVLDLGVGVFIWAIVSCRFQIKSACLHSPTIAMCLGCSIAPKCKKTGKATPASMVCLCSHGKDISTHVP